MAHKGGQQEHVQKSIGDYLTIQQIGSGSFAVVWKAKHKVHGYEVAIKEINTERLNKKLQENLLSEIAILKKADHPNIIRLHEIVEAPNRIYLVLEYCAGGDLAAYITRCGKVSEGAARHFMQQLGNGLQVLRTNNLIHRDLKPQNLLLSTDDSNAVLKIADFGFARSLQPQGMAETLCGSPLYMAPEILQFQRYDAKADLWSVGAILYQLVAGRPPFFGNSHVQLLQNITKNDVQFSEALKAELHPDCIDICRRLLRRNPVERLSFEEFFNHSFMRLKLERSSWHQPQNTTTTGGMSTDLQQEDCLPFLLDDDPQTVEGVPPKRQLEQSPPIEMRIHSRSPPSGKLEYGSKDQGVRLSLKHGSQSPKPFRSRSSDFPADAERIHDHADSFRGVALADSLDCIEREYVLVSAYTDEPPTSLGASGAASSAGKLSGSPQKSKQPFVAATIGHANLPVTPINLTSRGSTPPGNSQGLINSDEMLEGPSQDPPTRISSLKRCARLIAELAADKLGASQIPEALSVQLVCLAIWKEALQICHTWGASTVEKRDTVCQTSGPRGGDSASFEQESEASATIVCSQLERDFSMAVEHAEKFAAHLGNVDGGMEMPDAIELIFQAALAVGRAGAVEELMGNVTNAAVAYAKSSALLYFLLVEASCLPLNPPFALSNLDRHRLCRYAEMLTARLNQCTNARQLLLQQQEQAGS